MTAEAADAHRALTRGPEAADTVQWMDARGADGPMRSVVVVLCRAGAVLAALPVEHVVETMRPLPTEPLGGVPPYVRGVSVIRGAATPVVELGAALGRAGGAPPQRFVTLRLGRRCVALAVDSVIGVRRVDPGTLGDLPPLLAHAAAETVEGIGTLDAELLLALRAARLVPESTWAALGAAGAGV